MYSRIFYRWRVKDSCHGAYDWEYDDTLMVDPDKEWNAFVLEFRQKKAAEYDCSTLYFDIERIDLPPAEWLKKEAERSARLSRGYAQRQKDLLALVREPLPNYGDHMTLGEFLDCVRCGGIIDDDGCGSFATETEMSVLGIETFDPDEIEKEAKARGWTHVVWFNT